MHFVEHLFGMSPDGGNGLLELSLFLIPLAAAGFTMVLRRATSKIDLPVRRGRSSRS